MTDVVLYEQKSSIELAPEAWQLAQKVSNTDFVPKALRGKPEATLACILTGHELGIGAMQALQKINVIEGKPGAAAELMRALILRAGHELWVEENTNTRCTIVGKRQGSERETRVTWTADDVQKAGLAQKDNHKKYPRAMLLARATAELARMIFPDVLAGISYTTEELSDGEFVDAGDVDANGNGNGAAAPAPAKRTAKAKKAIARDATAIDVEATETKPVKDQPPLPGEDAYEGPDQRIEGPRMTGAQAIAMRCQQLGVTDRDKRLALVADLVGREPIDSTKDLDADEISMVLQLLNEEGYTPPQDYLGEPEPAATDDASDGEGGAAGAESPPTPAAPANSKVNVGLRRRVLEQKAARANVDDLQAFSDDVVSRPLDEVLADPDIADTNKLLAELEAIAKREAK